MTFIHICNDSELLENYFLTHTLHDVSQSVMRLSSEECDALPNAACNALFHYAEKYPTLWEFFPWAMIMRLCELHPSDNAVQQAFNKRQEHILYRMYRNNHYDIESFIRRQYFEYCDIQDYYDGFCAQPEYFQGEHIYRHVHIKMLTLLKSHEFDITFLHKLDIFLASNKQHLDFLSTQERWRYVLPTLWFDQILQSHHQPDAQDLIIIINSLLWMLEEPCVLQPWNYVDLRKSHIVFILESIADRALEGCGTLSWMQSLQLLPENYSIQSLMNKMRQEPWDWEWLHATLMQPMILERSQQHPEEPWLESFFHAHFQKNTTMETHRRLLTRRYPKRQSSEECDLLC